MIGIIKGMNQEQNEIEVKQLKRSYSDSNIKISTKKQFNEKIQNFKKAILSKKKHTKYIENPTMEKKLKNEKSDNQNIIIEDENLIIKGEFSDNEQSEIAVANENNSSIKIKKEEDELTINSEIKKELAQEKTKKIKLKKKNFFETSFSQFMDILTNIFQLIFLLTFLSYIFQIFQENAFKCIIFSIVAMFILSLTNSIIMKSLKKKKIFDLVKAFVNIIIISTFAPLFLKITSLLFSLKEKLSAMRTTNKVKITHMLQQNPKVIENIHYIPTNTKQSSEKYTFSKKTPVTTTSNIPQNTSVITTNTPQKIQNISTKEQVVENTVNSVHIAAPKEKNEQISKNITSEPQSNENGDFIAKYQLN